MASRRSVQMRISSARRRVRESGTGGSGRGGAGKDAPPGRLFRRAPWRTGKEKAEEAVLGTQGGMPQGSGAAGETGKRGWKLWRKGRAAAGPLWEVGGKGRKSRRAGSGKAGAETQAASGGDPVAVRGRLRRSAGAGGVGGGKAPRGTGKGVLPGEGDGAATPRGGKRAPLRGRSRGVPTAPREIPKAARADMAREVASGGKGRKRGSRRGVRTLLLAALLASLGLMLWVYMYTDVLNVRSVVVEGNRRLQGSYIASLSGIGEHTHLLKMDVGEVERSILSEPYVAEVRVHRRFPYTVVLEVREREPLGIICQGGKYHLVDAEGVVVESLQESPGVFIEMRFPTQQVLYPGVRLEGEVFPSLVTLLQAVPSSLREVTTAVGRSHEDGLYLECWGTKVIFGTTEDLARKVTIMDLALMQLSRRYGKLDYIDVSFPDRPVFKPGT